MSQVKILIIGFGSIGQKHFKILKNSLKIENIRILTSQKNIQNSLSNIAEVKIFDPGIIIIASTTNKHFKHLQYVNSVLKDKVILVEKPLFHKTSNLKKIRNKILVGYNLRFHPIIQFIKKISNKHKILSTEIYCSSYAPNWRNRKFKTTSTSSKKLSGGILHELSHEIDYARFLLGDLKKINIFMKKNSNLKINFHDYANIIATSKFKGVVNINLNYYSKLTKRFIILDTNKLSLFGDLINGIILFKYKNGNIKKKKFLIDKDYTYKQQLESLISKDYRYFCKYEDGVKTVKTIEKFLVK